MVFKPGYVGAINYNQLLIGTRQIEQPVPPGHIQQPVAPALETVSGCGRFILFHLLRIFPQRRSRFEHGEGRFRLYRLAGAIW